MQVKAPRLSACTGSTTALDTASRIAAHEAFGESVTFSDVRLPLVRTEMVTASDACCHTPPRTSCALGDRPLTVDTVAGTVSEVVNLLAPRLVDAG